ANLPPAADDRVDPIGELLARRGDRLRELLVELGLGSFFPTCRDRLFFRRGRTIQPESYDVRFFFALPKSHNVMPLRSDYERCRRIKSSETGFRRPYLRCCQRRSKSKREGTARPCDLPTLNLLKTGGNLGAGI